MTRDQKIRIAMVICAVVLVCAVIISATGLLKGSGLEGYSHAEKYTAGETEIEGKVRNLDVRWTSGQVNLAFHEGGTVKLEETAERTLKEDEKLGKQGRELDSVCPTMSSQYGIEELTSFLKKEIS